MTALSIVQTAAAELGLPQPSSLNNTDLDSIQWKALLNRSLSETLQGPTGPNYWQSQRKQYTFQTSGVGPYTCTITAGSTTLSALSSTTGIVAGQNVYASGLVNDTLVISVNSGASTCVISQAPTASTTLTGQSVTFATENYPLPSDFGWLIVQTEWDRNFRWQLLGPLDAQEWQVIKSGISPVGPRMRFRIMQNQFYINPVGSASTLYIDTIAYEYVSNTVATSAVGVPQTSVINDADIVSFDEDMIQLDVKWRFLHAKGLDFETHRKTWSDLFDRKISRTASARNLPINARASGIRLLNSQNVPDTGFGS
jgi:hypothetical protein